MPIVLLPVSGVDVELRLPAGAEDLLLVEGGVLDIRLAIAVLERLTRELDGAPVDPRALPITELDVLLLRLRQHLIGDAVSAEARCSAAECGARVDISFSIAAYLAHHTPAGPAEQLSTDEPGWYRFADDDLEFRIPQVADHLAIAGSADPEHALVARCIRGTPTSAQRARIEDAMEAIAPSLYTEVEGVCPECGVTVAATFDPLRYLLRELRDQSVRIYDQVAAIAHHFHWSEAEILALPRARRTRYAEVATDHVRQQGMAR